MPQFNYVGMDEGGTRVTGTVESTNRLEAYAKLESIGINPIAINEVKERGFLKSGRKKVSRKDLITFTFQMEQLLSAGVPLLAVLDSLRQSFEEPGIKEVISAILEDLKTGQTLSEAMARHPKVFSPVYISLVQVGEQTGRLESIFKDLAAMLRWEDELAAKAKKAGYTLVLDKNTVVFTDGSADLTKGVLEQLNANDPRKSRAPAPSKVSKKK